MRICRLVGVSKSGYYKWRTQGKSRRQEANEKLVFEIRMSFEKSRKTYGSPRITVALRKKGIRCGENRVAKLMRKNGIKSKHRLKYKATTNSKHNYPVAVNIVRQVFAAEKPNCIWAADMTYVWTKEGWLYVSIIIDLYAREAIGLGMSDRIDEELASKTLRKAIIARRPEEGLLYHSDRGSPYASTEHQEILKLNGIIPSMSDKGNPYDNAPAESFIKTLKVECVAGQEYKTREEAKAKIFEYVEAFYNRERIHSSLGYKSPEEYEREYAFSLNK